MSNGAVYILYFLASGLAYLVSRLSCSYFVATISQEVTYMQVQTHDSVVRARIETAIKERASAALAGMGLSISDAIRLLLVRVAHERRLPFEIKAPNAATRRAIEELEAGKGEKFDSVAEMMAALDADD